MVVHHGHRRLPIIDALSHSSPPHPEAPRPGAALVGRQEELAALERHHQLAMSRQGSLVVVEGASGLGKSHLLEAFCQQLRQQGHTVIQSLGRAFNGQRPLENLEPVLRALELQPAWRGRVARRVSPWLVALHHSHPRAHSLFEGRTGFTGEHAPPHLRMDEAWVHLLNALGEQGQAVTLVLDDAQWMDSQSAQVLRRWWREQPLEGSALLVVLGVRPGAHPSMAGLGPQRVSQWLTLEPLDLPACARLALGWMPTLEPPVLQELHHLCEGNPFLLKALVQNLQAYAAQDSGAQLHRLRSPGHGARLMQQHLEVLSPQSLELLEVGALLGRSFDIHQAAQLLELPRRVALRLLQQAQERDLVQVEEDHRATFTHDKLREAAQERLEEAARQQLHLKIARSLARQAQPDPFAVAYHFQQARRSQEALPHARRAAALAQERGAHQQALENLAVVQQALGQAPAEQRLPVLAAQAEHLVALGHYQEGQRCLKEALGLCQRPQLRTRLEMRLGELTYRHNDYKEARVILERAMRGLGGYVPGNRLAGALWTLWCALLWNLATPLLRLREPTRPPPALLEQQAEIRRMLGYIYGFLNEYASVAGYMLQTLHELSRYKPGGAMVSSLLNYNFLMMIMGRHERALEVVQEAHDISEGIRDKERLALSLQQMALTRYTRCELEQAQLFGHRALQFHENIGQHWDFNLTLYIHGMIQLALGNLEEALRVGLRLYQRASLAQEDIMITGGLRLMHDASLGQLPCDSDALDEMFARRHDLDRQQLCALTRNQARHALARGELEAALAHASVAQPIALGMRLEFTADTILMTVTVARLCWEQLAAPQASPQRRVWHKALRALEGYAATYPLHRAAALRERAWWLSWHKQPSQAREHLQRAHELSKRQSQMREHLQVLQDWATMGHRLVWHDAAQRRQEAQALHRALSPSREQIERARAFLGEPGPR